MLTIHPKILQKDGKKEFAVIPYNEFLKIKIELEDYALLKALRKAKVKEADASLTSFDDVKKELLS